MAQPSVAIQLCLVIAANTWLADLSVYLPNKAREVVLAGSLLHLSQICILRALQCLPKSTLHSQDAVFERVQDVQMAGMSGNAIVQGTHMKAIRSSYSKFETQLHLTETP